MAEQEEIIFITNDKWVLQPDGVIDITDKKNFDELRQNGKLVLLSSKEAFAKMQELEPGKFKKFKSTAESNYGKELTIEELAELAKEGSGVKRIYDMYVDRRMNKRQAKLVRQMRIDSHYSWRLIARSAFGLVVSRQWPGWIPWDPPSNQLMGMALCARAAEFSEENYYKPPWN